MRCDIVFPATYQSEKGRRISVLWLVRTSWANGHRPLRVGILNHIYISFWIIQQNILAVVYKITLLNQKMHELIQKVQNFTLFQEQYTFSSTDRSILRLRSPHHTKVFLSNRFLSHCMLLLYNVTLKNSLWNYDIQKNNVKSREGKEWYTEGKRERRGEREAEQASDESQR